jgi:hypothetical protein
VQTAQKQESTGIKVCKVSISDKALGFFATVRSNSVSNEGVSIPDRVLSFCGLTP